MSILLLCGSLVLVGATGYAFQTRQQTATANITVVARDWQGRVPYPAALPGIVIAPQKFPDSPVYQDSQGYDVWPGASLGFYEFDLDWRGKFEPIASGPNTGLWYLKEPPAWRTPVVYLSGHLEPGHPFYEAQMGRRPGEPAPPPGYSGYCTKADMDLLRQQVLDHEGAISGPRLSHHEFNVDYVSRVDPGPATESIVFYLTDQTATFSDVTEAELGKAYEDQLIAANLAAVHDSQNIDRITCKVHMP